MMKYATNQFQSQDGVSKVQEYPKLELDNCVKPFEDVGCQRKESNLVCASVDPHWKRI